MRQRVGIAVGGVLLAFLFGVAALGHRAVSVGGVYDGPAAAAQFGAPDASQVVYGELPSGRASLWAAIDVPAATDLVIELGIPVLDRLRTYRLQWALLGPDLPLAALPLPVPTGLGAMLLLSVPVGDARVFHEPVTDTRSWIVGEGRVHAPTGGRYYLVAWSTSVAEGKAWMAIGEREAFGWADAAGLRQTIESVRAFHEAGPDARFVAVSKILYLAGIALVIALLALL